MLGTGIRRPVVPRAGMRCALLQPTMHWTPEANLRETLEALRLAARAGVQLLIGPELGLSGFHRRVLESFGPQALVRELAELRSACAELGIAAAVGLPWRLDDGRVFNSHLYVDGCGELVGRTDKRGLTPSEATVFAPGRHRDWTVLAGAVVSSVLCRETLDGDTLLAQWQREPGAGLGERARLLLWPSFIGESGAEQSALTRAYRQGACEMAVTLQAWVLQSNWPQSLNRPEARGLGASWIVAPDGRCVAELPADEPGLWDVELGVDMPAVELRRLA